MKGIVQGCFLTVASVLLTLALAELLFHLFPSLLPLAISTAANDRGIAHPLIGNVKAPDSSGVIRTSDFSQHYQLDELGFHNKGPLPSQADIVVIGDSLVFGYGVDIEQAWPQILARLSGKSVVNLGLIGASPQQYLRIYQTFGRALKPRIVVLGFFAANDFWDAEQFEQWQRSGVGGNYLEWRDYGRPKAADLEHFLGRMEYAAKKHLYLVQLLGIGVKALTRHPASAPEMLDWDGEEIIRLDAGYLEQLTANAKPGNPVFTLVMDSMVQLQRLVEADGGQLLVVFEPGKEVIYLPFTGGSPSHPSVAIGAALEQRNIATLQLIPAFQASAEAGNMLFFPTDGHPNALGYRLIAEQVAQWLARNEQESPSPGSQ
ncbi:MAG: hypothetical protein IPF49_07360 [Gammaproteobacteria bacterium]|nr:hypothetical protein [Gammaproteobacteria bacterium]